MYNDLKKYLRKHIKEHEEEMEICENMKPKPLLALREKNYFYMKVFRNILQKVEEIEDKENDS